MNDEKVVGQDRPRIFGGRAVIEVTLNEPAMIYAQISPPGGMGRDAGEGLAAKSNRPGDWLTPAQRVDQARGSSFSDFVEKAFSGIFAAPASRYEGPRDLIIMPAEAGGGTLLRR